MFNVNNSHFGTGITPSKWMSTKNYGKIIDIQYDGPAKKCNIELYGRPLQFSPLTQGRTGRGRLSILNHIFTYKTLSSSPLAIRLGC